MCPLSRMVMSMRQARVACRKYMVYNLLLTRVCLVPIIVDFGLLYIFSSFFQFLSNTHYVVCDVVDLFCPDACLHPVLYEFKE